MSTMRNKLIHDYFEVDYGVAWPTVKVDLPPLRAQMVKLMEPLRGDWYRAPALSVSSVARSRFMTSGVANRKDASDGEYVDQQGNMQFTEHGALRTPLSRTEQGSSKFGAGQVRRSGRSACASTSVLAKHSALTLRQTNFKLALHPPVESASVYSSYRRGPVNRRVSFCA